MLSRTPSSDAPRLPRSIPLVLAALLAIGVYSCKTDKTKTSDKSPEPRSGAATGPGPRSPSEPRPPERAEPAAKEPSAPAPARKGLQVVRSLLKEAGRAEVRGGGLFVDLGTQDQTKYIGNCWASKWGQSRTEEPMSIIKLVANPLMDNAGPRDDEGTWLSFHDWQGDLTAVVVHGRSEIPNQKLGLYLQEQIVGTQNMTKEWKLLEYTLDRTRPSDFYQVNLRLDQRPAGQTLAELDWIWFRTRGENPPHGPRVKVMNLGDPRRVLVADGPRVYSYYLLIPPKAKLLFGLGAAKQTTFAIHASQDDGAQKELFSEAVAGGSFRDRSVDLSAYGDQIVRLDFMSTGSGEAGWAEPDIVVALPSARPAPVPRDKQAKHFVHVLVDTARQDAYGAFNPASRIKTPAFDGLAKTATLFPNAHANANWTLPSVATILTGLYFTAFMEDSAESMVPSDIPVLPEILQKNGLYTAAIVANRFVSKAFGLGRGWDLYRDMANKGEKGEPAQAVFEAAAKWLRAERDKSKRFYLYIHTMDPHAPYYFRQPTTPAFLKPPYKGKLGSPFQVRPLSKRDELIKRYTDEDRRYIRALYDGEVAFHELGLPALLAALRDEKLLGDTLVIISNDHGEELFDHGSIDHGHSMYDELVRSPLLVHYPPLFPAGLKVAMPVELVDLLPTALEVLGLPPYADAHGHSLPRQTMQYAQDGMDYAVSLAHNLRSIRLGRYKYIRNADDSLLLFDLEADPAETKNLVETHPIVRRACELYLAEAQMVQQKSRRVMGQSLSRTFDRQKSRIDPKLREQLRALGYLD